MRLWVLKREKGYTFMSDRQKGLLKPLDLCVQEASSRYCWRHLWSNFKQKWVGEAYMYILWSTAKATTEVNFHTMHMMFLSTFSFVRLYGNFHVLCSSLGKIQGEDATAVESK